MPEERAFGAAVIAVLIGIVGAFTALAGLFVLIGSAFNTSWGSWVPSSGTFFSFFTSNTTILAAVVIILGLIYLAVAVGLWRQHFWALVITFIVGLIYVIGEGSGLVYSLFYASPRLSFDSTSVLGSLIALIVVLLVLAYLAAVRDDFI